MGLGQVRWLFASFAFFAFFTQQPLLEIMTTVVAANDVGHGASMKNGNANNEMIAELDMSDTLLSIALCRYHQEAEPFSVWTREVYSSIRI